MCGIAGVVRLGPSAPPPTREEALAMARRIRHRGPDGLDAWASPTGRCALGHARLKVIDLETGGQPMANEDGTVRVVYNGEIYNFRELRSELGAAGHRFRSRSDTEVLAHGYEEWGDALPERLDGMFAFAVWDEARGRLLLARDRPGEKPLFWTRAGERLAFASELGALGALPWVPDEIDPAALPYYLAYGYVPAPATLLRGIEAMPPATRMVARAAGRAGPEGAGEARDVGMRGRATAAPPGGKIADEHGAAMAPRAYWRLEWGTGRGGPSRREAARRVRELLGDAVERRLVADVPLGAFLSGGIDSTIVVGLARERCEGPLRTFSLGFRGAPEYDETAFARRAARAFGTEHTEFTVEPDSFHLVDRLVEAYGQPFGDSSAVPTYIVSRLTRERVTVALTGDGGDELFAGYPRLAGMALAERIPRPLARMGDALGRRLPYHPDFRHPTRRLARFFHAAALPPEERMLRWIGFLPADPGALLRPGSVPETPREALTATFRDAWDAPPPGASPLARALALTFATYLPEDLLVKADRCSMAHGLELRAPFLDTALVEFAARLPDRHRVRGIRLKWLLRAAFRDVLPPEIARRGKWGFGVPLAHWLRTHWKRPFEDRMFGPRARSWAWLRREPVEGLWREHLDGRVDHGHALWALLTLETWLRARDP